MKKVIINGMHCNNCKARVERAFNAIEGVTCEVDLNNILAKIDGEISDEIIKETIDDLGFEVVEIK